MPLVKNTITGNNYLVKINTDGDACSRTAIRSYDKQYGINGSNGKRRFYLPFSYDPSSHTLWVFVNGEKAVVEQTALNNRQYVEVDRKTVQFGAGLGDNDVIEFIVAGSYLNDEQIGGDGTGGLTWVLTSQDGLGFVNNYGYMVDTLSPSGAISFVLPADPDEGDTFAVADAFGNFGSNPATLTRANSLHKIDHVLADFIFDRDGMAAQFVFDGIDNWLIVNDSGFITEDTWTYINSGQIAAVGAKYMVDTSSGVLSVQCPPSPVKDNDFIISDYSGSFYTNNLTITQNGELIMGLNEDLVINVNDVTLKFVYIDSTQGWRIVTISS